MSISTNGYVCLGNNTGCHTFARPKPYDILVGLNKDLDTSRTGSGQIYYQIMTTSSFFTTATTYTNLLYFSFVPTNGFMITYDGVYPYDLVSASIVASFQVFLL